MLNFKIVIGEPLNCGSPSRKELFGIDDLVLGGIAAGAGSLLGSVFSGSSQANAQDRANQTNLQIARETNAHNEKLWQNQVNYQTQMWNEANDYNSPQKQKERLLAGGINPSAVFGNGSMAEASNLSAPSANPAVGAHVEPVNYAAGIGEGISNGLNAFFDSQLKSKEIERKGYENKILNVDSIYKDRMSAQHLKFLENQAKREGVLGDLARTDLAYYQAINGQRISQSFGATRMQERQIKEIDEAIVNKQLQNRLSQVILKYQDRLSSANVRQLEMGIQQIKANIGLINANAMLTNEQKLHEAEKRVGTVIENGLKGVDFGVKRDLQRDMTEASYFILQEDLRNKTFERRKGKGTWLGSDVWNTLTGRTPF